MTERPVRLALQDPPVLQALLVQLVNRVQLVRKGLLVLTERLVLKDWLA